MMVKVYEQGNLSKHMDSMKVRERERERAASEAR